MSAPTTVTILRLLRAVEQRDCPTTVLADALEEAGYGDDNAQCIRRCTVVTEDGYGICSICEGYVLAWLRDRDCPELCRCCGRGDATTEYHPCPYHQDVNGDGSYRCNCCDECRQNCVDSI